MTAHLPAPGTRPLSRRRFAATIGVASAGAAWLAACGGSKNDSTSSTSSSNAGPAATVSANAPVATGIDPETLIPDGIKKNYPLIYQYHWSRQTFSKNTPKSGGKLTVQTVQDNPTWDPTDPGFSSYSSFPQLFFNRLVKADMSYDTAFQNKRNFFKLLITTDAAAKFEQVDPTTFTFTLRPGIKFHNVAPVNGHELTTEDVKFAFETYRQPAAAAQASIFRHVDKIDTPDKYTIKITMKQPAAYFLYSLAGPLTILFSRQGYEKASGKDMRPTGTGPFILDKHEYRNVLNAKKNPEYFVQGKPYLDEVESRWIPDRAAYIAAYRTGQVDAFTGYGSFDEFDQIMKTEKGKTDVNVFQQNSGGQPHFGVMHTKPPFNDLRVRRAISMALDRNAMVKARYKEGRWSIGIPTDWTGKDYPSTPAEFGANFKYSPEDAKKLLAEAGSPNLGWTITAASSNGQPDDQIVLAMEYWKAIGLKPELKVVDTVAFNKAFFGREFEGMVYGAPLTGGTDLDDFTYRLLYTNEPGNIYGVSDPALDSLLLAQQKEFDRSAREKLGAQILQKEFDNVNRIWAASYLLQDFKRPYVQGGYISHDVYFWAAAWGMFQLADTWLDK